MHNKFNDPEIESVNSTAIRKLITSWPAVLGGGQIQTTDFPAGPDTVSAYPGAMWAKLGKLDLIVSNHLRLNSLTNYDIQRIII